MGSETMRQLMGGDEDNSLLPDDIPSDSEFDDYTFGTFCTQVGSSFCSVLIQLTPLANQLDACAGCTALNTKLYCDSKLT
jgi:hypothetical protein